MKRLVVVALILTSSGALAQEKALLNHSIVGSESCQPGPCYSGLMGRVAVQRFFLELAKKPMEAAQLSAALAGTDVTVDDLLALRLVRREGSRFFLNFPLFTAADVKLIHRQSELYAASLAQAVLARRADIESALSVYDAPGVDRKAVAYFLLGCVSLDWDGLDVTAERGYRKTAEKRPNGNYIPAAEEKTEHTLKGIYWGSHNARFGETGFTSFGDHFSHRVALPDLVWRTPGRLAARAGDTPEETAATRRFLSASLRQGAMAAGLMMLALRDGEKTAAELSAAAKLELGDAETLLHALSALQYVDEKDGRWRALVPVLAERDRAMSDRLRQIGREVMEQWLEEQFERIRSDLKGLSFTRSGVAFEEGFTMLWHYIFGMANRRLVEDRLFADPYGAERRFKGAIPAVYVFEYQK